MLKKLVLALVVVALAAAGWLVSRIGPRNLVGMLLYDQRREGDLEVGDKAPDVTLRALDGTGDVRLLDSMRGKPLVIVFGSYT